MQRKWYHFNYARATYVEAREVLRLCDREDSPGPIMAMGETRVSYRLGGENSTSTEILKYRHLFDYVPDLTGLHAAAERPFKCIGVNLPPDSYFEDEHEQPISLVQILDQEAQRARGESATAIILDHPESILRHGPAEPIRAELWTQSDADLMSQLSNVYGQIVRSRWLQVPCVVSVVAKRTCRAEFPVEGDCLAIVLPFRQLYSKDPLDDLFNRCCNVHNRHCPIRHPTHHWVAAYKARFNEFLERPVGFPHHSAQLPARRYLDAFAYGANVIHASSRTSDPATDLHTLLADQGKEMVVMGYHYALRTLLSYVSLSLPVIEQNVNHWVRALGWAASKRVKGQDLFCT